MKREKMKDQILKTMLIIFEIFLLLGFGVLVGNFFGTIQDYTYLKIGDHNREQITTLLKQQESKMFTTKDFGFCLGPVICGHIHTGPNLNSYIFYNGSPIRWCFGEEETKGFQIVLYDMDTRYYYVHKEPIYSFRYDTISIDDIIMSDPKQVIDYINNLKKEKGIDYIRLKCMSNMDTQENLNILKEYYRLDKTVKWKIIKEEDLAKESMDKKTQDLYNQYSYFFNKSMSPYEILARFVNESQTDMIVSADQIIEVLRDV